MKSTLVQYHGKYYAYKGAAKGQVMDDEDMALAIRAFESAYSADAVALYIFKMTEVSFIWLRYRGIYRDDGLVVFDGKWFKNEITRWLCWYQTLVNQIVGDTYLQFTTELWELTEFKHEVESGHEIKGEDEPTEK
eukprot:9907854-Ditylum_brightwellii.AAC.2